MKKKSIVLLHGVFESQVFDHIKKRKFKEVFILEGRPQLEAGRISCGELLHRKIVPTLISDNMAGFLFFRKLVKEICISYQTADEKGALCHIGALILGVLGKKHGIPVYLFPGKPQNRFMGDPKDILSFQKKRIAPVGIKGYVPLVEWLPRKYITKIME